MADETTNGTSPVEGAPPAAAPTAGQQAAPDQVDGAATHADSFSREYVQSLREEAASYRRRLRELEDADKERKQADMTESERQKVRIQELEARNSQVEADLRQERVRAALRSAAAKVGITAEAVDDVYLLIDQGDLDLSSDGRILNAEAVVKALVKQKPYLRPAVTSGATQNMAGNREQSSGGAKSEAQLRAEIYGAGADVFDSRFVAQHGGGAFVNDK